MNTSADRQRRFAIGLLAVAIVLAAGAAAAALAGRDAADERPAYIHVRWRAGLDAASRDRLETRLGLSDGKLLEGDSFGYLLNDTSPANVRALVTDPAVADTDDIDRQNFAVEADAGRAGPPPAAVDRAGLTMRAGALLGAASASLGAMGLLLLVAPDSARALARPLQQIGRHLTSWLIGRIPDASPEAVALFRVAFGAGAIACLTWVAPVTGDLVRAAGAAPGSWLANPLASMPSAADIVTPALLVTGLLFMAGAVTRFSYPAFVGAALLWAMAAAPRYGAHPFGVLLLVLVALLPSRWSDAWSVDSLRRRPAPAPPHDYGYTIWAPGVVMAMILAAAAVSKLRNGGIAWILNGTVKYHFLTDSPNAPVDWGLMVGSSPAVAVALSFGAVAIELLVLPAVLGRRCLSRAVAGLATFWLLAGFFVFQGVVWAAWWLMLLSFVPWTRLAAFARSNQPAPGPTGPRQWAPLAVAQFIVLLLIGVQQLVTWTAKLEVPPLLSAYDMYSTTYAGPDEYERASRGDYRLVATTANGLDRQCEISSDDIAPVIAPASDDDRARRREVLERCLQPLDAVQTLAVHASQQSVDWTAWRPLGRVDVTVAGPVPFSIAD